MFMIHNFTDNFFKKTNKDSTKVRTCVYYNKPHTLDRQVNGQTNKKQTNNRANSLDAKCSNNKVTGVYKGVRTSYTMIQR